LHIPRVFALGVLSLAAAALPASAGAAGWSHFTSALLHFSIDYPTGWHTVYSAGGKGELFKVTNSEVIGVTYIGSGRTQTAAHAAAGFAAHDLKHGWHLSRITNGSGQSSYTGVDKSGLHQTQMVLLRGGTLYGVFVLAYSKTYTTDNQFATHMAGTLAAH